MTALERRSMIRDIMRQLRKTTIGYLAVECQCSVRTIQRDIIVLSTEGFPVETIRGKYDGGVKLPKWYLPHRSTLSKEQLNLLIGLSAKSDGIEKQILLSIIEQFGP